jgi:uncharacterized membrane protein
MVIMEAQIPLWLVITVVAVALSVGAIMIGVVVGKYALHQWFHVVGGPVLTGFGVALIGLTVYGNVTLKAGEFEFDIHRLQAALEDSKDQTKMLASHLAEVQDQLSGALEDVNSTTKYMVENKNLSNNQELFNRVTATQQKIRDIYDELVPKVAAVRPVPQG